MKTIFTWAMLTFSGIASLKAQVPLLSSHPSASAVIFLDFDGHRVTGTTWNYNGPINCGASGLDNVQVTTIYNRVAEDYRPFDINVTTDSTKFLAAPANKRMRVIATTSYEWYGTAGGVAFVSSFTWGDDTPCFVFTSLLNYNLKNIAEACSHEAGHTLNLQHQSVYNSSCVKTAEYNTGTGGGEIGWAPIMGAGYYQNMTLWNSGKSSLHCDSIQNDLEVITSNGFGFRTDEHGNSFGTASEANFVNNHFTVSGIISQNSDHDMIRFTQPANGRFQLNAIPYNVGVDNAGSNLDLQVTLYDGSQNQINVYNPGTLLNSVIDSQLNAGTYYLKIEGKGNIYAPNYASLGSYSLSGDFIVSTLPLRKLELKGDAVNSQHKLTWIIDADEAVSKQILEVSTDGRNFAPLIESPVANRGFNYKPYQPGTLQYRLNVTFDNGRQIFSNIIQLQSAELIASPKLVGNVVSASISVSSSSNFNYSIYEMSGRMMSKGTITNGLNSLYTGNLNKGLYIIRFTNGYEQWTEKFMKQ